MSFVEFVILVESNWMKNYKKGEKDSPYVRKGQRYFCELMATKPKLAEKIEKFAFDESGPSIDPFYNDEKIPEFLLFCQKNWDKV